MYIHLIESNLFLEQKKGYIKNLFDTIDQLLLDKAIIENCRKKAINLNMSLLNYQKAYDGVPQSWLKMCLQMYGVPTNMKNFITDAITNWRTKNQLKHEKEEITLKDIS